MLTKAKPSSLKSSSDNLEERKQEPKESKKSKARSATHTRIPKGSTNPHGSTSTLPRPANTLTGMREIGHKKSTASSRGAFKAKGPRPTSASCNSRHSLRKESSSCLCSRGSSGGSSTITVTATIATKTRQPRPECYLAGASDDLVKPRPIPCRVKHHDAPRSSEEPSDLPLKSFLFVFLQINDHINSY
ncbi:hypothetical protein E2C01_007077 [Portunus trituberculatus]|uniref:Uncharacterized protein n=1 Tax=Portunus trituberculatus TaxID=210409 RepID=A0A5B7D3J2_PORTR|nr:hypothetical protein [Portunus trituberculatus]